MRAFGVIFPASVERFEANLFEIARRGERSPPLSAVSFE